MDCISLLRVLKLCAIQSLSHHGGEETHPPDSHNPGHNRDHIESDGTRSAQLLRHSEGPGDVEADELGEGHLAEQVLDDIQPPDTETSRETATESETAAGRPCRGDSQVSLLYQLIHSPQCFVWAQLQQGQLPEQYVHRRQDETLHQQSELVGGRQEDRHRGEDGEAQEEAGDAGHVESVVLGQARELRPEDIPQHEQIVGQDDQGGECVECDEHWASFLQQMCRIGQNFGILAEETVLQCLLTGVHSDWLYWRQTGPD